MLMRSAALFSTRARRLCGPPLQPFPRPTIFSAMSSSGKADEPPSFPFARPADDPSAPPREFAELRRRCPVSQAKLFDGTEARR